MSLKVNQSLINELALKQNERSTAAKAAAADSSANTAKTEEEKRHLNISKEGELLDKARRIMQESADVDLERVNYFKSLLVKGEYTVNNQALAAKLAQMLEGGEV